MGQQSSSLCGGYGKKEDGAGERRKSLSSHAKKSEDRDLYNAVTGNFYDFFLLINFLP